MLQILVRGVQRPIVDDVARDCSRGLGFFQLTPYTATAMDLLGSLSARVSLIIGAHRESGLSKALRHRDPIHARCFMPTLLLVLWGGCTQSALVGLIGVPHADGGVLGGFDAAGLDGAPGYVDGRLHAHAEFNTVKAIYWFGGDNDPSRITIWIYENAPKCLDLSMLDWIPNVRPTDLMRITAGGTTPGTYSVIAAKPPRPGNAYMLHVIDQADPVIESEGQSGTVVIADIVPGVNVTGTFDATFSTGSLQGEFIATWCPTGVSP